MFRERAALGHGRRRQRGVSASGVSQRTGVGRGVGRRLFGHHGTLARLAAGRDGMRGADVRARRHHRDVGGEHDEKARGGSSSAGGRDIHHHRRAGGDQARDERPCRIEEAARRSQHEHGGDRALALCAGEQIVHELRRNRMDDPVVLADDDQGAGWFRLWLAQMPGGSGTRDAEDRGGNRSGSHGPESEDRDEPHTGCAFHGTCDLNPTIH